jgi:hypothetical protein
MSATLFKLLKKPFFGRFMVKWQNPLSLDQQKEWQQLRVKSKSGGLIYGLFAKATAEQVKATIVLGHPMGKEAKAYFLKQGYTDLLRKNGFNTIVFDINGFGESTHGNFDYFEDIVAIGIEAAKLTPGLPIGYHGISLGGQWATVAFADENHKYDFAIIESAATSLDAFWINFPTAYKVLQVLNFCLPNFRKKVDMKERIKEAKRLRSLLLIYSLSDELTPVAMGKIFQDNSAVASELWTVESANHAAIMKSGYRAEYEAKMIDFFNKNAAPVAYTPANYEIAESSPLSDEDILKIKKDINTHYSVNILLIPLLIIIYFWGFLFFFIFLLFVLWYNISASFTVAKRQASLNNPKLILTGKVTSKSRPGEDELIVYFGSDRFELTYANSKLSIEIGDLLSLHYSQLTDGEKGILLKVEKPA